MGYSLWGGKESDTTERLTLLLLFLIINHTYVYIYMIYYKEYTPGYLSPTGSLEIPDEHSCSKHRKEECVILFIQKLGTQLCYRKLSFSPAFRIRQSAP